jgi:hypothetical protein
MLVKSSNGVRAIWSAGCIFLFWRYRSTFSWVCIRLFSSAPVQTKYELPMWNVRVWDDASTKHDLNYVSYHLCTTEIWEVRYIYRTCLKKSRDDKLKTTTKINELPMRPVFGEVCPVSRSMEASVRSSFDKGGKDTRQSYVLGSLYCGVWFLKLSCMYETFAPQIYNWTSISSLRKVINAIIWIWFLSIRLKIQHLWNVIAFN